MTPAPPPPPPPQSMQKSGKSDMPKPPANRGALLSSIQKGKKLKKAVTNDRSAPIVSGKTTSTPSTSINEGSSTGNETRQSGGFPSAGGMGGLFAGGMPKLRSTGSNLFSKSASKEAVENEQKMPKPAPAQSFIGEKKQAGKPSLPPRNAAPPRPSTHTPPKKPESRPSLPKNNTTSSSTRPTTSFDASPFGNVKLRPVSSANRPNPISSFATRKTPVPSHSKPPPAPISRPPLHPTRISPPPPRPLTNTATSNAPPNPPSMNSIRSQISSLNLQKSNRSPPPIPKAGNSAFIDRSQNALKLSEIPRHSGKTFTYPSGRSEGCDINNLSTNTLNASKSTPTAKQSNAKRELERAEQELQMAIEQQDFLKCVDLKEKIQKLKQQL